MEAKWTDAVPKPASVETFAVDLEPTPILLIPGGRWLIRRERGNEEQSDSVVVHDLDGPVPSSPKVLDILTQGFATVWLMTYCIHADEPVLTFDLAVVSVGLGKGMQLLVIMHAFDLMSP